MNDDYLLGNAALHARFLAIAEILAKLVSRAPRSLSVAQLESETGRGGEELSQLCGELVRAGVARGGDGMWQLAGEPSSITLEDVFRCTLARQPGERMDGKAATRGASEVDLLVMQAMLAINQSVFMQLRRFSLDRIGASAAGAFPRRAGHRFNEDFDALHAGIEPRLDRPAHAAV